MVVNYRIQAKEISNNSKWHEEKLKGEYGKSLQVHTAIWYATLRTLMILLKKKTFFRYIFNSRNHGNTTCKTISRVKLFSFNSTNYHVVLGIF